MRSVGLSLSDYSLVYKRIILCGLIRFMYVILRDIILYYIYLDSCVCRIHVSRSIMSSPKYNTIAMYCGFLKLILASRRGGEDYKSEGMGLSNSSPWDETLFWRGGGRNTTRSRVIRVETTSRRLRVGLVVLVCGASRRNEEWL